METFPFMLHTVAVEYQSINAKVKFGRGFEFAAAPNAPIKRDFTLKFETLRYYQLANGQIDFDNLYDGKNLGALEAFYRRHLEHKKFIYPKPGDGNIICRFKEPLKIPEGLKGGNGWVNGFEVRLTEER